MNRTFVIGDIHGGYKALLQCFERSNFDYENDTLISLGDICDGWPQTKEVIDELLKIKNFKLILGNHDWWTLEWILYNKKEEIWITQGGRQTLSSYGMIRENVPETHVNLLKNAPLYFIDEKNRVFVHGGFPRKQSVSSQPDRVLMWDRSLISQARDFSQYSTPPKRMTQYEEVFIGHTPVSALRIPNIVDTPVNLFEIWALDTGAGWEGKITIMNVETKEYFQSDIVYTLYPGSHARDGQKIRRRLTNE